MCVLLNPYAEIQNNIIFIDDSLRAFGGWELPKSCGTFMHLLAVYFSTLISVALFYAITFKGKACVIYSSLLYYCQDSLSILYYSTVILLQLLCLLIIKSLLCDQCSVSNSKSNNLIYV